MKIFYPILFVAIGGSLGAVCRYLMALVMQPLSMTFPSGTLIVNMAGCLIIGSVAGLVDASIPLSSNVRLFFVTGFCGALTTMSSFVYETDRIMRSGQFIQAIFYFGITITGSFMMFFIGYYIVKILFK
jgi:fluoride exporter